MTKTFDVAHIHEQGEDIIIIPLQAGSIAGMSEADQNALCDDLQYFANDANLAGTVCLVWQVGKTFNFLAPEQWHAFFRSIDMYFVRTNLNRTLRCTFD